MGDLWYLALAYGVIWLGLCVYMFSLAARAEGLKREVSLLKAILQSDRPGAEGPDEVLAQAGSADAGSEA